MFPMVYNYLMVDYLHRTPIVPNNVHKRSELRSIYNAIIKINKNSPLYKVNLTQENQSFAIDVKEHSTQLSDTARLLFSNTEESVFSAVRAYSENNTNCSLTLITPDQERYPEPFTLKVNQLADVQINTGKCVSAKQICSAPGNYSFSIVVEGSNFEFQYKIKKGASNEDTLNKLSDFINKSNIGIESSIDYPDNERIQIELRSIESGTTGEPIFKLLDTSSPANASGLISYFGMNEISQKAKNAEFEINGSKKEALSNQILLNKALQIDLINTSEDTFSISYHPDSDIILSKIKGFQSDYNSLVDLAANYKSEQGMPQKLMRHLRNTARPYLNELESCGISFEEKGKIVIDDKLALESIESKEINSLFSSSGYIGEISHQSASIILNPMEYVDKTLISYKNFSKPSIAQPYVSSIYSGMLFNYYC